MEIESAAFADDVVDREMLRASRTHAFFMMFCQTQSKGWNFPMKMRSFALCRSLCRRESDSEYAYRHDDDHTYAYAATLK